MIVSFSVSNFRSFSTEETLSLVASKRLSGTHQEHTASIPDSDERVLRTAVIYGANGAGKSNLFKALQYLRRMALEPQKKDGGTGREAFRLGETAKDPSSFDLQFIADGKLYRFGLKVNDQRVTEEWLVRVVKGRERLIYERITDQNGKVTVEKQGLRASGEKVVALATVGGLQNQSFLATAFANLQPSELGEDLRLVAMWFSGDLLMIAPDSKLRVLSQILAKDQSLRTFAGDFLKSSSTGIDHLDVLEREITEEDIRKTLPENLAADLAGMEDESAAVFSVGQDEYLVERVQDKHRYYRVTVQAAHDGPANAPVPLEIAEESDGTRRLLELIPALYDLRNRDATYFVDEIDRSMHPLLVWKFIQFFLNSCTNANRQLIVTTHESNLLDLDLLRRDEIWFAEKDPNGATRLYSMVDFKVRKDHEIRKHYLQGRFGAVPFLGNVDRLLETENSPE
ncbi:MAG TPA: ATP/GTP-binding protein [Bryobacteraceae bacterium]|jgi:hypothetical protein